MSEEMAVSDNTTADETNVSSEETAAATIAEPEVAAPKLPEEPVDPALEESPPSLADSPPPEVDPEEQGEPAQPPILVKQELLSDILDSSAVIIKEDPDIKTEDEDDLPNETNVYEENGEDKDDKKGIKRRASAAFSDNADEEFRGFFDIKEEIKSEDYQRVLERLEAEVIAATKTYKPLRTVMATPPAPTRASKRARKDTDGSRPSSALSSKSDGDGSIDPPGIFPILYHRVALAQSPAARGRRATTEMSSPLLRVPLERGWKRELVYRAALDAHSRRNADIYYYTPHGKKLRSTREVGEHLAGTGLTLENFSFFKEPLGVDDPEKEIIRDAKFIRRIDSPIAATTPATPVEGKRTPKPKAPKGASPEPQPVVTPAATTIKSPPAKIKQVKSVGSRLSAPPAAAVPKATPTRKGPAAPAPAAPASPAAPAPAAPAAPPTPDNNNSAAWKKPRPPPPPPLVSRPPDRDPHAPDAQKGGEPGGGAGRFGALSPRRQLVQPCSMTCGRGVPSLACAACLCLYHAACAGYLPAAHPPPDPFLCKNCRKSTSPPLDPPPLTHKSGVTGVLPVPVPVPVPVPIVTPVPRVPIVTPVPRRVPVPVPVPVPAKVPRDKRVLLRMKVAGGTPDGERVWAVSDQSQPQPSTQPLPKPVQVVQPAPPVVAPQSVQALGRARGPRPSLPQSLAVLNGRRFIIVPRSMVHAQPHEVTRRGRVANGASSPPALAAALSPRRRGRQRADELDHFTAFYNKAQESNECYNVVVQIFQYLGMRDLAHCARVCRLWKQMAATPALWRHVRMKNSHVSDWGGLCSALKRHGTKRLDLRKMLLPQNDSAFWEQFAAHIGSVASLERVEMCRCPARAVEALCRALPGLRALSALAIRDAWLDPAPLGALPLLHELRLKSMAGLSLTRDLRQLGALTRLQHLSLTSIKELGWCLCDVIGSLPALESLELGECTFRAEFAGVLARLTRLRRVRLERGTPHCAAPDILRALAALPLLTRLELVNIDVKPGFDDALAACTNVQRLLIIPTYVSQSATTNRQVLSGVLRLKDSLTHLMWGVTIELLRVTELFIDQCEQAGEAKRRDVGECIPVLKPVPGCRLPDEPAHVAGPPQVEILPLPTLQRLLSAQLPATKLKLLRIPFHATWRQSLADFQ